MYLRIYYVFNRLKCSNRREKLEWKVNLTLSLSKGSACLDGNYFFIVFKTTHLHENVMDHCKVYICEAKDVYHFH